MADMQARLSKRSSSGEFDYSEPFWDLVASRLNKEGLHRTAVELSSELQAKGKGINIPGLMVGNNVKPACAPASSSILDGSLEIPDASPGFMERSASLQTFDSLDLARHSEDGEHNVIEDKIAVLEFELRKAKETINSLRSNLTVVATNADSNLNVTEDSESSWKRSTASNINISSEINGNLCPIQPYERRAINFLVNHYLLRNNYKITSITFCDENVDQDLEDWNEVGLDIPQPPELLYIYRFYCQKINNFCQKKSGEHVITGGLEKTISDVSTQTEVNTANRAFGECLDGLCFSYGRSLRTKEAITREENDNKLIGALVVDAKVEEKSPTVIESDALDALNCTPFQKALFEDTGLSSVIRFLDDDVNLNVSACLSSCLPRITPNIPTDKICSVIPLITAGAMLSENDGDTQTLLRLLFNIVGHPDDEKSIASAFVYIAQIFGVNRTEKEIIPMLLEGASHECAEKRLLIFETLSSLTLFVSAEFRMSTMFPCFLRMLKFENDKEVFQCSVQKFAAFCSAAGHDNNIQCINELLGFILDAVNNPTYYTILDPGLSQIFSFLLPAAAYWVQNAKCMEIILIKDWFQQTLSLLQSKDLNAKMMLKGLNILVPFAFAYAVQSVPSECLSDVPHAIMQNSVKTYPFSLNLHQNMHLLLTPEKLSYFYSYVSKEWYRSWPEIEWLLDTCFAPDLIDLIPHVFDDSDLLCELIHVIKKLCYLLKEILVKAKIKPLFDERFRISSANDIAQNALTNGYVPVYFCALVPAFAEMTDEEKESEVKLLQHTIATASLLNSSLRSLKLIVSFTFRSIVDSKLNLYILLTFLSETLKHSNYQVRKNVARLYARLLDEESNVEALTLEQISQHVWNEITILLNDDCLEVRVSGLTAFGSLLRCLRSRKSDALSKEATDNAHLQLQSFLEEPQNRGEHSVKLELIKLFDTVASVVASDNKYFDSVFFNFAVPRLAALTVECRNTSSTNLKTKKQTVSALIKAYSSFSRVPLDIISDQMIRDGILPALRYIRDEAKLVSTEYEEFTNYMIGEYERRSKSLSPSYSMFSEASLVQSMSHSHSPSSLSSLATSSPVIADDSRVKRSTPVSGSAKSNLSNFFQLKRK